MAQIGIKLADGTFYPVMEDDAPRRVRVLLSPAQTGQNGVQIDIIRRDDAADQYVGCLVLENLELPEGEDLEFILGLDRENTLDARVGDASGEQFQSLSVSLSHLDDPVNYSLPDETGELSLGVGEAGMPEDLDLPGDMPDVAMPDLDDFDDLDFQDEGSDDRESYAEESYGEDEYADEEYQEPRPYNPVILVAIILITLSVLALGAYGILRLLGAAMLPELRASSALLLLGTRPILRTRSG